MNDVGEKEFLKSLLPNLRCSKNFLNGFGHDSSILDFGLEKNLAFKIDRAPSPISIKNGWSDYRVWGRLAVVANVSDLVASGANAKAFMLSLIVPGEMRVEDVEGIVKGCAEACEDHGISFVGGDTKEGCDVQVVGSCVGTVQKNYHIGREVARAGDHLVIAGKLGGFLGGYHFLKKNGKNFVHESQYLEVLTHPSARVAEGEYISTFQVANAGCDLSDGLSDALSYFCSEQIGIVIEEASLPIHDFALEAAAERGACSYKYAFGVGDWAVAYVVSNENFEKYLLSRPKGLELVSVGVFNSTGDRRVQMLDGTFVMVPDFKNEHFRARLEDEGDYMDFVK